MQLKQYNKVKNLLLNALSSSDDMQLMDHFEPIDLVLSHVISEPGDTIHDVYFPVDSFISLVMPLDTSVGLEVGLIGNEGMYGLPVILGVNKAPFRAIVQGAGLALRMDASAFMQALTERPNLNVLLKRYMHVSIAQLAQTAACNRYHVVEERLARWLLMTKDRAHREEFHITQEFLARMLGVRRVGVTKAAGSLQRKKLISYSRGNLKIHDIKGLEKSACSCYLADKKVYANVMQN